MYSIFFEFLLFFYQWKPISNVTNSNHFKKEITRQFYKKNYSIAEKNIRSVLKIDDSEPELMANLALVLFEQKNLPESKKIYLQLQNSSNVQVTVESLSHLGIISCIDGDTAAAINYFENALKKDYKHQSARYNLELLKKVFTKKAKQQENNALANSTNSTTQKKISDPKSDEEALLARLNKINMTESQAKILFDALGKNEIKYIYQKKRLLKNSDENYNTW